MRRFKGFTLTELMIALAVLGILVAVVTPAIMRARPNKNKMMVKKTFYTVENIVSSLINDETLYPDLRSGCGDNEEAAGAEHTPCAWGFDYTGKVKSEGEVYGAGEETDDNNDIWDDHGNPTSDDALKKFALLFKSKLNVKNDSDTNPVTNDGVTWVLTGVIGTAADPVWEPNKDKVGTFSSECKDDSENAGCGVIKVKVDDSAQVACSSINNLDCNYYEIQVLANGKLRIDPNYGTAVNWVNINTSIKN